MTRTSFLVSVAIVILGRRSLACLAWCQAGEASRDQIVKDKRF